MKRLVSLDILRGLAIIGVIFTHASIFNSDVPASSSQPSLLGNIILYFLTWAGIFAIISGIGNTIAMYSRVREGTWTPKQVLTNSLIGGMITLLVNYLYLGLFSPGFLPPTLPTESFLSAFIRRGIVLIPNPAQLLFATALMMIAWGTIFSGICVYFITKKFSGKVSNRAYIVLGIVAIVCILIYTPLQTVLRPLMVSPLTWLNFGGALVASWIVGPMDPMLPYVGFAIFGVIFGLLLVDDAERRRILFFGYGAGIIITIIGFTWVAFVGVIIYDYDTPPLATLISILGPMLLLVTASIHVIDLRGDVVKQGWLKHSTTVRAFGLISLTGFLLEGPFAALVRQIVNLFLSGFTYNASFSLFFSPLLLILWWIIVRRWAKVHFKYSFEYFIIHLTGKLTGKKTDRLNVDYILRSDSAYLENINPLQIASGS
ncbi:MAG TPA: heparan-alpha-glucosaminide N-acetyltransferase domain-containing protein [Candidatus Lokiarchaeia archaeon]|nr:heparan-alpha-glucosaminide N-acetyltransferase domain-containing protein [Candidatus Lokiarchaeia archaeon]